LGKHQEAAGPGSMASWAEHAIVTALLAYVENNAGALIDYGERYKAGRPSSVSRVEDTVNHLVSACMNERQQIRWTPVGAHRVLQVRAAVRDGCRGSDQQPTLIATEPPRFPTVPNGKVASGFSKGGAFLPRPALQHQPTIRSLHHAGAGAVSNDAGSRNRRRTLCVIRATLLA
jgi:hypothetical protein